MSIGFDPLPEGAVIYGAGGHARELRDQMQADGWTVHVFVDDFDNGREVDGTSVVSFEVASTRHAAAGWFLAIGDSRARRALAGRLDEHGLTPGIFVSSRALVLPHGRIEPGAQIFAHAVLSSRVRIGRHAIVNYSSVLSHDVVLGDFVTISPGAHVAGNVRIMEGALIGVGASVRNGTALRPRSVGAWSIVGAGACVIDSVPEGAVVAGVPAKPMRRAEAGGPRGTGQTVAPESLSLTALIVTFNQVDYLREAFDSVRRQTIFDSTEVLISDDASSDGTFELARSIAAEFPNVSVRRNDVNMGIIPHYRHALRHTDTDLIAILEGDDLWHDPEKLARQRALFTRFPDLEGSFTGHTVSFESSGTQARRPRLLGGERSGLVYFEDLLLHNPPASFSNCMYRRQALVDVLSADIASQGYDWLVNLMMADRGPLGYLEGDFATYRVRPAGTWEGMEGAKRHAMEIATLSAVADCVRPRHRAAILNQIDNLRGREGGER